MIPAWLQRSAVCVCAGALMRFAFAPVALWPLALLSLATLFYLLRERSPGQVFRLSWLFGFAMFGAGTPWVYTSIHEFGNVWAPAAALVTVGFAAILGLFPAIALGLLRRVISASPGWILAAPFAWVLGEWVRSWFLGGFPWLSLGYSHTDTWLVDLAPLGGVFLISLLLSLLAAVPAVLAANSRQSGARRWWFPAAVVSLGIVLVSLGRAVPVPAPLGQWQVAIVQGNFGQDVKFRPDWLMPQIRHYVDTTLAINNTDLIVWPETVLPRYYHELEEPVFRPLAERMAERDAALVLGALERRDSTGQVHNAVVGLGQADGWYRKRKLVPLGEYFPLRPLLGLLPGLSIPFSDMSPGARDQALLEVHGQPVGVSICYEDAFGGLMLADVPAARALINVSNDAWFGQRAPWQHLQMARMRAAEVRRSMVRSTTTGVSALIGPGGELLAVAPPFEKAVLRGQIDLLDGRTPYMLWADWPVVVMAWLGVLGVWLSSRRNKRDPRS